MAEPEPNRPVIRVGDAERQVTIERLTVAHSLGQLDLAEFDERTASAIAAKTAADLAVLTVDLPLPTTERRSADDGARAFQPQPQSARPGPRGRFVGSGWLGLVLLNVLVWAVVSISSSEPVYFWPMWVAVGLAVPALFGLMDDRRR